MSTVVVRPDSLALVPANQREAAVSIYLEQARDRLAYALEASGPEAVASIKAEVSTAAEATKQLGLSKEIRDDATEMVRRAEYSLGKAIRKGQADGSLRTNGQRASCDPRSSASEVAGNSTDLIDVTAMADNATDDEFAAALVEAREEGNLSRANLVRKIRSASTTGEPLPPKNGSDVDSATVALLNDLRGPWRRGITRAAKDMSPAARAHLIEALETTLNDIKEIS